MNRKNIICHTIISIIVMGTVVSCTQIKKTETPEQIYYYEFNGFITSPGISGMFEEILNEFKNSDYIITLDEVLKPIQKGSSVSVDSLSPYHRLIHRIELVSNNNSPAQGAIKMKITYLLPANDLPSAFQYERYIYSNSEGWVLEYNLGKHYLVGTPNHYKKKIRFLATEIARASFK